MNQIKEPLKNNLFQLNSVSNVSKNSSINFKIGDYVTFVHNSNTCYGYVTQCNLINNVPSLKINTIDKDGMGNKELYLMESSATKILNVKDVAEFIENFIILPSSIITIKTCLNNEWKVNDKVKIKSRESNTYYDGIILWTGLINTISAVAAKIDFVDDKITKHLHLGPILGEDLFGNETVAFFTSTNLMKIGKLPFLTEKPVLRNSSSINAPSEISKYPHNTPEIRNYKTGPQTLPRPSVSKTSVPLQNMCPLPLSSDLNVTNIFCQPMINEESPKTIIIPQDGFTPDCSNDIHTESVNIEKKVCIKTESNIYESEDIYLTPFELLVTNNVMKNNNQILLSKEVPKPIPRKICRSLEIEQNVDSTNELKDEECVSENKYELFCDSVCLDLTEISNSVILEDNIDTNEEENYVEVNNYESISTFTLENHPLSVLYEPEISIKSLKTIAIDDLDIFITDPINIINIENGYSHKKFITYRQNDVVSLLDIKWKGKINDEMHLGCEWKTEIEKGTNGEFGNKRLFYCSEGKGVLIPIQSLLQTCEGQIPIRHQVIIKKKAKTLFGNNSPIYIKKDCICCIQKLKTIKNLPGIKIGSLVKCVGKNKVGTCRWLGLVNGEDALVVEMEYDLKKHLMPPFFPLQYKEKRSALVSGKDIINEIRQ